MTPDVHLPGMVFHSESVDQAHGADTAKRNSTHVDDVPVSVPERRRTKGSRLANTLKHAAKTLYRSGQKTFYGTSTPENSLYEESMRRRASRGGTARGLGNHESE